MTDASPAASTAASAAGSESRSTKLYNIEPLKGSANYATWKTLARDILIDLGLWDHIDYLYDKSEADRVRIATEYNAWKTGGQSHQFQPKI